MYLSSYVVIEEEIMTAEKEIDGIQDAKPATEEQRPLVDFPTSQEELKGFLRSASKAGEKASAGEEPKDCVLGLYLEPGTTVDVDKDCNFKVRPMTPEELDVDKKRREYMASPQYKTDMEKRIRELR